MAGFLIAALIVASLVAVAAYATRLSPASSFRALSTRLRSGKRRGPRTFDAEVPRSAPHARTLQRIGVHRVGGDGEHRCEALLVLEPAGVRVEIAMQTVGLLSAADAARARPMLERRADARLVVDALIRADGTVGGYRLWIDLPPEDDAADVATAPIGAAPVVDAPRAAP